jgi:uncharacterized protein (DUF433 family)
MTRLISDPAQAAANVRKFAEELPTSPELQATLAYVQSWYALRLDSGSWIFGPSKFIAYPDNTAERFVKTFRKVPDGGRPEKALAQWFSPIDLDSRLGTELMDALTAFLAQSDRTPRRRVRISVVSDETGRNARMPVYQQAFDSRISINPLICGGRPCIKGTRMRVSDIVDMLAAGASRETILEDFPYLADEDISAALACAARAIDHRVIRAA